MAGTQFVDRAGAAAARKAIHTGAILAGLLHFSESAVTHQLRLRKTLRLVTYRREGKKTLYMLDDEHSEELIRPGVRHLGEVRPSAP